MTETTVEKKKPGRPKKATRAVASRVRTVGTAETKKAERPKRVPLYDQRNILAIKGKDPKYEYRLVNDSDGRIARFKLAGWEHVTHDLQVGDVQVEISECKGGVATVNVRGGIVAYIMRIKKEFYEADQSAKQQDLDASQEAMYRELNDDKNGSQYGKVEFSA